MTNINTNKQRQIVYDVCSLSHNDLDGISSQIVLKQVHQNIKLYNCNYDKIDEYIEYLDNDCHHFRPSIVYVTDLSFSYEQGKHLAHLVHDHPGVKFVYIDHHPYEEKLESLFQKMSKKLDNFTYVHTEKACATKLTYKYLVKQYGLDDERLGKYVEQVNAYDIWQMESEHFKGGFLLNELFYKKRLKPYYFEMVNRYQITDTHKQEYKALVKEKNKYFDGVKEQGLIFTEENKMFIFADQFKSWVTVDWSEYDIHVIGSTYARISVRLNGKYSTEEAKEIQEHVIEHKDMTDVVSMGGHYHAWGVTLENGTPIERLIYHMSDLNKILAKF